MLKNKWMVIVGGLGCLLFILMWIYYPGLSAPEYIIDDQSLIQIPQLKNQEFLDFLKKIFLLPKYHLDYFPLRDISYWLDIHLFGAGVHAGDSLTVFRIHQFFLFYLISISLFILSHELKLDSSLNQVLLLCWVLHPYHAEMLMWITARKDLLGILFAILYLIFYLRSKKQKNSYVISICFLIASALSKNVISSIAVVMGIFGLVFNLTNRQLPNKQKLQLYYHGTLVFLGGLFTFYTAYFYSNINDMRFEYSLSYRIQSSLASLGRMLLGWVNPDVNAIDVFNWGDWGARNSHYVLVSLIFISISTITFFLILKKRDQKSLFYIGLFFSAYLPISGLLFPHRNFYSVRYFEPASLVILFFLMHHVQNFQLNKKISCKTQWFLALLATSTLILAQIHEAKNWISPRSTVEKALRLDPQNPSLLAELSIFDQKKGLLDECENNIEKAAEIKKNGDLCWFNVQSHFDHLSLNNQHSEDWLIRHSEKNSSLVSEGFRYLYAISKSILQPKRAIQVSENVPVGFLNNEFHRILYFSYLCTKDRISETKSWTDYIERNHLVYYENLRFFVHSTPEPARSKLKRCLTDWDPDGFVNRIWIKSVKKKKNEPLVSWWLDAVAAGASGSRNGCGRSHANGYDCGSTMDQASMVNLYVELFDKTDEEKFLEEALYFAKNGNQMCSVSTLIERPCGDGKAQGTWLLALIKLLNKTRSIELRRHLIQQLKIPVSLQEVHDLWDYYEIYRSYLVGFQVLPEARQESFFDDLKQVAKSKGIASPRQIDLIQEILNCAYGLNCRGDSFILEELDQEPVKSSVIELMRLSHREDLIVSKNSKYVDHFEKSPLQKGRMILASCSKSRRLSFFSTTSEDLDFLNQYKEHRYEEEPKPYYYFYEGDHFSPMLLAGFNKLFGSDFDCAHWELAPKDLKPLERYYGFSIADDFEPKRRPVFFLIQLDSQRQEMRFWIVSNTHDRQLLSLSRDCLMRLKDFKIPNKIELSPLSQKSIRFKIHHDFDLDILKGCFYLDQEQREYPLYP